MQTIEEVWEEVGRRNRAAVGCEWVFSLRSQTGRHLKMTFQATRGNLPIVAVGKYERVNGGQLSFTADLIAPEELYVGVYPWSYSDIFTKVIGAQDIVVGTPEFDSAFVIKSNHEEWARLWLGAEVRAAMLQIPGASLILNNKKALLRFSFSLSDDLPDMVAHALDAISALQTQGHNLSNPWRQLAQEMSGEFYDASGMFWVGAQMSFDLRGVPIIVEVIWEKPSRFWKANFFTRITGRKQRAPSVRVESQSSAATPEPQEAPAQVTTSRRLSHYKISADAPQRLSSMLQLHEQTLAELKPAVFASEGEIVSMKLRGVILQPEVLQKAASVVAAFCPIINADPYR